MSNEIKFKKNIDGSKSTDLTEEQILALFSNDHIDEVNSMVYKVIEAISRAKSVFKLRQIIDGVVKKGNEIPKFARHEYFEDLVEVLVSRVDFVKIPETGYFTTYDTKELEFDMIKLAGNSTTDHILDTAIVEAAIAARKGISDEQKEAVYASTYSDKFVTVVEGTAGAGKSFTMAAVKKSYIDSGYHVMGTALSWNAAGVLAASTGLSDCEALQGLLNKMKKAEKNGIEYFRKPTLLIVDEAGLVGSKHMSTLLKYCYEAKEKVKVVLTGDSLQLNPIEAGNALEALVSYHGTTRIDTIRRQRQDSHKIAVKKFSQRFSGEALYTFKQQEALHWCENKETQYNVVVRDFLSYKYKFPDKKPLILALSNADVSELNKRVRAAYKKMGLVYGHEVNLSVTDGKEVWKASFAIGDEVVVRANSKELLVYEIPSDTKNMDEESWIQKRVGVFNRNNGRVVGVKPSKTPEGSYDIVIDMVGDLEGRIVLNTKKFRHQEKPAFPVVHNFATTIYASQGQTVNKVFLIDSDLIEFRLAYVGMSRHTDSVEIYLNESELHTRLDKNLGKAKPSAIKKQDMHSDYNTRFEELPVTLGRYTKTEMLNSVANNWGKDSKNETALIFAKNKRTEMPNRKQDELEKERFKIRYAGNDEPIVDFDTNRIIVEEGETWELLAKRCNINTEDAESFKKWLLDIKKFNDLSDDFTLEKDDVLFLSERLNVKYPLIDLQKLLDLPDPVCETITISDSDVEESNHNEKDPTEMPLRRDIEPDIKQGKRAYAHFEDVYESKQKTTKEPKEKDFFSELGNALFSKREVKKVSTDLNLNEIPDPTLADKARDFLQTNFGIKPHVEVPLLPEPEPLGYLNRKGLLEFTGEQGVSEEFLKKTKGVYWGEGKNYEPRIFSPIRNGEIVSRFTLSGRCVTGEAYPPMLLNPDSTENTPIMLFQTAKEWLWTFEFKMNKPTDNPELIPHFIWAAEDVDWGYIGNRLKDKTVLIAKGNKDTPEKIEWAIDLQEKLWKRFNVKAIIRPGIPERINPWDRTVEINNKPKM